ncbi:transcription factor S [Candidatus Bathyarchaeota archaeon]|nr:transcription factor S [Candidatus Bathyarchaeota archaeon]MBS7630211.1 transcription factor S [Candidatus Bathyarchaeota archaeon]
MKFCSRCGSILTIDREKQALVCPKCGTEEMIEKDVIYSKHGAEKDKVVIIGKKELNLRTTPQVKIKCPMCGNSMAYWWMVQTRGIDESSTQFYRCTKCDYTWREYS